MKPNELIIGDWVKYGNRFAIVKGITTNECLIMVSCNGNDELIWETYDNIEPILVTHEILEKNGFETQPNIGHIIDDWGGTQIIYDSWNHNLRIIKNYKVCLDIETFDDITVHELQHALKLCEIEREIKL